MPFGVDRLNLYKKAFVNFRILEKLNIAFKHLFLLRIMDSLPKIPSGMAEMCMRLMYKRNIEWNKAIN